MRISWEQLSHNIESCQACGLAAGCRRKVPGQGDPHAPLMLIGEGPGEQEDRQGLAFVGPAGQLLTRMLAAISLPRDRVYICNVVKCRPPNNRQPTPEEMAACLPHLRGQAALVRPRVILLLGATAVAAVLALRVDSAEAQQIALDTVGGGEIVSQEVSSEGLWNEYSYEIINGDTWYDIEISGFGSVTELESVSSQYPRG